MYLYFVPCEGFNDILTQLSKSICYCTKYNRTLLFDTTESCYEINWSNYFTFNNVSCPIIYDINIIKSILNNNLTVYPLELYDIITNKKSVRYTSNDLNELGRCYMSNNNWTPFMLPTHEISEDVVVYHQCGGDDTFNMFCSLKLLDNIKIHCKNNYLLLPKPYLGIQIRNTDYKCDYVGLYETNKDLINSYSTIYIATDCKEAIDFFKTSCVNSTIFNFTTFPDKIIYNLHYSDVDGDTKIKDLFSDIYIITMCDKFLTNSNGLFVYLLNKLYNNNTVKEMFN
jgi:hypothetical protein